jgi:hypothetical protein
MNDELLPPEQLGSDFECPDLDSRFDELVGESEPAAIPSTPVIDHTRPESRELPEPADQWTAGSEDESQTERAEPCAEADVLPSDGCEPESEVRDSQPPTTQQGADSPASARPLMPAVVAAESDYANVVDDGALPAVEALGQVRPAAHPTEAMEVAILDAALLAAYALVLAEPTGEEEGNELEL